MKIYQVFESGYEQNDLLGTFTTRKLANKYAKMMRVGRTEIDDKISRISVRSIKISNKLPYSEKTRFYRIVINESHECLGSQIICPPFKYDNLFFYYKPEPEYITEKEGDNFVTKQTGNVVFVIKSENGSSDAIEKAIKKSKVWKRKNDWPKYETL
jgi:hypothetical protein